MFSETFAAGCVWCAYGLQPRRAATPALSVGHSFIDENRKLVRSDVRPPERAAHKVPRRDTTSPVAAADVATVCVTVASHQSFPTYHASFAETSSSPLNRLEVWLPISTQRQSRRVLARGIAELERALVDYAVQISTAAGSSRCVWDADNILHSAASVNPFSQPPSNPGHQH